MKYMLMMHYVEQVDSQGRKVPPMSSWAPDDIKAHMAFMLQMDKELTDSGERVDGRGLAGPEHAKIVRAQASGAPAITDGPFPESKEFLAGYWIVDVDSPERAIEIAAQASAAPGPGGVKLSIPFEVREVMKGPPEEEF
jgi:hypothetical protein